MKGILLVNLGTPNSPVPADVGRYLREFLMDPYVVDIPALARWILVNLIIVPRRAFQSAEAYQKIWTARGSPLLFHTSDLTQKLKASVGDQAKVSFAMRYGNPSIEAGLAQLASENLEEIFILPLYPQYSLAATESSLQKAQAVAKKLKIRAPIRSLPFFYDSQHFIQAFATNVKESMERFGPDLTLFSFHGLPERQVRKTDPSQKHCLEKPGCCDEITPLNQKCYRAQCFSTARQIAQQVGLTQKQYRVCFQSRLGRTPWIRPYTDVIIPTLPAAGFKRVLVVSPSFVADCLETLEEIAIRTKEAFVEAGGKELLLVPSLNSEDHWCDRLTQIIEQNVNLHAVSRPEQIH